jgi:hypothetical protein
VIGVAMLEGRRPDLKSASALMLAIALAAGCWRSATPATLLDMGGLPDDADRRNERLDKAAARPGPEQRKPLPDKMQKVETVAASAAAVLGMIFSTSPNVLLGGGTSFDENEIFFPQESGSTRAKKPPEPEPVDASQLVPWVKLRPDEEK